MNALMVGMATVDIAYLVEEYPAEDSKHTASDQILAAGGPAANAAVTFAALAGQAPVLLTALGRNPLASIARRDLSAHHVSVVDAEPDAEDTPPLSSIAVSRSASTRTIVSRDGADFDVRFRDQYADLLDAAAIVLFDGHHPGLAVRLAPLARAQGIPIVLDVGRYKTVYDTLLPLADVAICSASFRPPGAAGRVGADAVLAFLHGVGVRHAAITNGPEPIRFSSGGNRPMDMPVPDVPVIDTLAAGDALHGAFCHYWLKNESFEESLARSAKVASDTCRYFGPRGWIKAAGLTKDPVANPR